MLNLRIAVVAVAAFLCWRCIKNGESRGAFISSMLTVAGLVV